MTKLVKIGSSYGVRIPKAFIEKAKLKDRDIDLQIVKNGLLLSPSSPRASWDSQKLRQLAASSECEEFASDIDSTEWEW
ncbi:AbrB/MazE/SpoVT family DNA-binding domain-containing protein [Helicobacter canis]|uniref:AbrB/MazE/SpoVT family DNA-binding domain-containing protein n=1 Tax=Helicobacter canis TaxID=29419 RepID=UPI002943992B|nr:AbrB/MazE/SpoVT family DNA-binding domain-containing protein [Helicobacter canis]